MSTIAARADAFAQPDFSAKIEDFKTLPIEAFMAKYNESPAFIVTLPKQKAIKRVIKSAMAHLAGRILIKSANTRDDSSYAIDTKTGIVFGMSELKPGGLTNAFSLSADGKTSPLGSAFIRKDLDRSAAPVIGIIGEDTYRSMKARSQVVRQDTHIIPPGPHTSHAGIYLGARSAEYLADIGRKEMTIAATDRYIPILKSYLRNKQKTQFEGQNFIMPKIIPCDGSTEGYLNRYKDIDVILDVVDSGTSVINAQVTHVQLLRVSSAKIVVRKDLSLNFADRMSAIGEFIRLMSEAAEIQYQHVHRLTQDNIPYPDRVMETDALFNILGLDWDKAEKKVVAGQGQPFYDVPELAV